MGLLCDKQGGFRGVGGGTAACGAAVTSRHEVSGWHIRVIPGHTPPVIARESGSVHCTSRYIWHARLQKTFVSHLKNYFYKDLIIHLTSPLAELLVAATFLFVHLVLATQHITAKSHGDAAFCFLRCFCGAAVRCTAGSHLWVETQSLQYGRSNLMVQAAA